MIDVKRAFDRFRNAQNFSDCGPGLYARRAVREANAPNQNGRSDECQRVQDKRGVGAEQTGDETTNRCAQGKHHGPGHRGDGIGRH